MFSLQLGCMLHNTEGKDCRGRDFVIWTQPAERSHRTLFTVDLKLVEKTLMVVPCSFICLICFTVSFRIAHLSGLTLKLSMSLKLAKISSASSSMYLFSCSRLRFSLLRFGLWRQSEHVGEKMKSVMKTVTAGGIKQKPKTQIEEQVWVRVCIVRARIPQNFFT